MADDTQSQLNDPPIDYEELFPRTDEDYLQFKWDVGAIATWELMHSLITNTSGRMLEVGPGAYGIFLNTVSTNWEVHAVDISVKTIESATVRVGRVVNWHIGELEAVSFPARHFDTIVSSHVIEHIKDDVGFLKECHRILKPGGEIVVLTPGRRLGETTQKEWVEHGHYRYYTGKLIHQIVKQLPDTQLEVLQFHHQLLGQFWIRFRYVFHAINYPFRWYLLRDNKSVFGRRWYQLLTPWLTAILVRADSLFINREGMLASVYLVAFRIRKHLSA